MIVWAANVDDDTSGKAANEKAVPDAVQTPATTVPTGQSCAAVRPAAAVRIVTVARTGEPASMPELPTVPVSRTETWNSPPTLAPVLPEPATLAAIEPAEMVMVGGAMSTPNCSAVGVVTASTAPGPTTGAVQTAVASGRSDSLPSLSVADATAQ